MERKSFCLPAQCLRYCHAKLAHWFRQIEALIYVQRNRRLIRDGSPGRPPRLSHSSCALSSVLLYVHRNRRLIRDGSPGRQPSSTAVETAIAQCTSRWAMARGHRLNTSIVLAAVHGLSGLFSDGFRGRAFTLSSPSHSVSVPVSNRPSRLRGLKAT